MVDDLSRLAIAINESEARIEALKSDAVQEAIVQGRLLAQAKAQLKHGEFTPWLKANCRVKPVQARKYIRLAAGIDALPDPEAREAVSALGVEKALKALAGPQHPQAQHQPPPALAKASTGELLAELQRRGLFRGVGALWLLTPSAGADPKPRRVALAVHVLKRMRAML